MGHKSRKTGRDLEPERASNAAPWLRKAFSAIGIKPATDSTDEE